MPYTIDLSYYLMLVRPMLVKYQETCEMSLLLQRAHLVLWHLLVNEPQIVKNSERFGYLFERLLLAQLLDA